MNYYRKLLQQISNTVNPVSHVAASHSGLIKWKIQVFPSGLINYFHVKNVFDQLRFFYNLCVMLLSNDQSVYFVFLAIFLVPLHRLYAVSCIRISFKRENSCIKYPGISQTNSKNFCRIYFKISTLLNHKEVYWGIFIFFLNGHHLHSNR